MQDYIPDNSIAYLNYPHCPGVMCLVERTSGSYAHSVYYQIVYYRKGELSEGVADGLYLDVCEDQGAARALWELRYGV